MKKVICFIIYYTGILNLLNLFYKKFSKGSLTILMYHQVGESEYNGYYIAVSPENFEKQIRYLRKNYNIISLKELCAYIRSKELPAEDCAVITLDDGYKDNYVNAYPILKRYNIPATIFLTSGYIGANQILWWDRVAKIIKIISRGKKEIKLQDDNYAEKLRNILISIYGKKVKSIQEAIDLLCVYLKSVPEKEKNMILNDLEDKLQPYLDKTYNPGNMLTWDEIIEMGKNGIDFGGHTITHPILTKIGIEQVKDEILNSKNEIEKRINKNILHFSYPNGKEEDFNVETKKIVRESGYISACSTIDGENDLYTDLFALKRKGINNSPFYIFAFRNSLFINFVRSKLGK